MLAQKWIETIVGLFILLTIIALTILAFKVSGLTSFFPEKHYTIQAAFDDIGNLKIKAPIKIGGVFVGEVSDITLDPVTFKAVVHMQINQQFNAIPNDSSASIYTAGLLGDNYIAITPMYGQTFLKDGNEMTDTHSAMILEKLIGQFIYKLSGDQPHATHTK